MKPRICGKSLYHHVFAWGNDRHPIFKSELHYQYYLDFLAIIAEQFDIEVSAYALMQWHVHLFIFDRDNNISIFMKELHGRYAQYYNNIAQRVGHVFGERYNNRIVQSNLYAVWLSRYIHRQAVEAGLVADPKEYYWSSYPAYIGLRQERFLKKDVILEQFTYKGCTKQNMMKQYKNFVLSQKNDPVDWGKTYQRIIGDIEFQNNIIKKIKQGRISIIDKDHTFSLLSTRLSVTKDILLHPHGTFQRSVRHQAILMMRNEYGLSITQIARILEISRFTVMVVVKEK
ncbi:hypothetical protein A2Y85_00860 [candidate division WOR-3 bacterium RBG_13_43_14]|uniref:Transposase IS200-like domain-containing protein n=1 Tax=candidate division WOR-3 bacterium RBG_13_43_14 TaxID=1802590 RepID=A0A1F4UDD2_UNCW3|nr:MAG: hypothetical protein A2Y85_00860 [candidate division WOR-3 bacterium RBG_13_43_14]